MLTDCTQPMIWTSIPSSIATVIPEKTANSGGTWTENTNGTLKVK